MEVVAITDRRKMVGDDLLALADWPTIAHAFGEAIRAAVHGCAPGSVIVQIREKDLDGGRLLALVRAAQRHWGQVIVNDRLDVALAAGALGVHLPERGLPVAEARRLAPRLVIGVSRHAPPLDAWPDATPDLIQLGTVWPTPSKPGAPTLGEAALAWPHGTARLVAVGGIDSPALAERASASGADAVAIIRAAWSGTSLAPFVAAVARGRCHRA